VLIRVGSSGCSCWLVLFSGCGVRREPHSFPTRRSSDLYRGRNGCFHIVDRESRRATRTVDLIQPPTAMRPSLILDPDQLMLTEIDRKSTRLNSSHVKISYAVICLKQKKIRIGSVLG